MASMEERPERTAPWPEEVSRARLLPRWAARYASNRTLPLAAFLALTCLAVLALYAMVFTALVAADLGRRGPCLAAVVVAVWLLAWIIWLCFIGTSRVGRRLAALLYRREGGVAPDAPPDEQPRRWSVESIVYMACTVAWIVLTSTGALPDRLQQPAQAAFIAPFLVWWYGVKRRSALSPFMLAWPVLLVVHAALLLAGAPILMHGGPSDLYTGFNTFVPVAGYGLLCATAGHLYSRFALRRVRALADPDPKGSM